ncbi:MAG: cobalt ECF transporter T component CbiQ [Deltaproteobacteria bacterium]|nr:cobalt ECF transporter T component CbiQ [Deltaproteobacteria bacterium]
MNFDKEYFNLGVLDTLSYKNTLVHRLDPRTKVITTFAFIVTVVSFPKYEIAGLIPFLLFPVVIFALGDIPVWFILKKVLVVSVFAVFIGILNPLFDTHIKYHFFTLPVSGGWVSFFSILLKYFLTMCSALLLISTTSFPGICHALRKLGVPEIFISQLLFLYRYIFVLMEETLRMVRAKDLRSFGKKGQGISIFINLVGTLFVKTIERAERIYHAMLSRGFTGTIHFVLREGFGKKDFVFISATGITLYMFRAYDIVGLIGRLAERMFN